MSPSSDRPTLHWYQQRLPAPEGCQYPNVDACRHRATAPHGL